MNAIELLKQQHETTKDALERMCKGDLEEDELRLMADELVAHMVIEEHVFYPRVRQLKKDLVKESFEEHTVARFELARVLMASGEERTARLTVLKELIEHHVEEEEKELFPKVQRGISAAELDLLGEKMEAMFEKAVDAGLENLVVSGAESGVELAAPRGGFEAVRGRASRTRVAAVAKARPGAALRARAATR
jgi:hemerythrin superfamily protein